MSDTTTQLKAQHPARKLSAKIRPIVAMALAVMAILASPLSSAQDANYGVQETADMWRLTTSPNLPAPTYVKINLSNVELLDIDPQEQSFEVEAYIDASWYDTRLVGSFSKLYQEEAAAELLKTIWWPFFEIADSRGPRTTIHRTIRIDFDGEVFYQERFSVQIKQDLELRAFPFDESIIEFTVVPFAEGPDGVRFMQIDSGDAPSYQQVNWVPSDWHVEESIVEIDQDSSNWASATAYLPVKRKSGSYVFGIIFPLVLILLVASAVFWMDLENTNLGDRLGVSFTALLTVVAFDFVVSDGLPNLWYLTVLDLILIGAYVAMAMAMVENVVVNVLQGQDKPGRALKIDRISRVLFPVGYVVYVLVLVLLAPFMG